MTNSNDPSDTQQLGFSSLSGVMDTFQPPEKNKYISQEFQDYGYSLAVEMNDEQHKSLYIKLAKEVDRALLEQARAFVKDAQARSKGRLFMWKLQQLRTKKRKSPTKA